jgi:hypothetical protein
MAATTAVALVLSLGIKETGGKNIYQCQ